jgi:hypothetical protein
MPRSTRLLILFSVFVIVAALFLLTIPNAAQTTISRPSDSELTATKIIADATQTSIAIGTPIPPEIQAATRQAAQATRTAIAITREPYLLTPQTPDEIQLTATHLMANYALTREAYTTPNTTEVAAMNTTATFIFQGETQTAIALTENPALGLTVYPTNTPASCEIGLFNFYQAELSHKLGVALQEKAEIPTAVAETLADVAIFGVGNLCGQFYPMESTYHVNLNISNLSDTGELIDVTERVLALLQNFPPQPSDGKVIRLQILFRSNLYLYKYIETGYANALAAYAEGLRGDDLIEALGGILDG